MNAEKLLTIIFIWFGKLLAINGVVVLLIMMLSKWGRRRFGK